MKMRCDMVEFGTLVDEPSSIVSNFLKPIKMIWRTGKNGTAVV